MNSAAAVQSDRVTEVYGLPEMTGTAAQVAEATALRALLVCAAEAVHGAGLDANSADVVTATLAVVAARRMKSARACLKDRAKYENYIARFVAAATR